MKKKHTEKTNVQKKHDSEKNQSSKSDSNSLNHETDFSLNYKFQCDLCNVIFYQKVDLNEHNSTIHITSAHEESVENENIKQKKVKKKILIANIAIKNSVPRANVLFGSYKLGIN